MNIKKSVYTPGQPFTPRTKKVRVGKKEQVTVTIDTTTTIDVGVDYIQMYYAFFNNFKRISGACTSLFLFWVIARCDDNNVFAYSKKMLSDFNRDLAEPSNGMDGVAGYSERAVQKSLGELVDNGIVTRLEKGKYRLKPELFWKTHTRNRDVLIGYEESNGEEPNWKARIPNLASHIKTTTHQEGGLELLEGLSDMLNSEVEFDEGGEMISERVVSVGDTMTKIDIRKSDGC